MRAPKTHKPCPGCYYLFHIGSGSPQKTVVNCTAGAAGAANSAAAAAFTPFDVLEATSSSLLHRSKTPAGPWEPLPSIANTGCNNPAPAFAKNGTLFVLCNSNAIWKTDTPDVSAGWNKVATVDLNASPWVTPGTSDYVRIEDPYLWCDANGNWHLFCHRYDYRDGWPINPNQTEPVLVSGHAFSKDLHEWHYSMGQQPFDPWVTFEDGTRQNFSTLERPHLVFNDAGVPTHSVHGASPVWAQYGDHHPCEVCPARPGTEHSCVVCKTSTYYSWTYTLTQELNV